MSLTKKFLPTPKLDTRDESPLSDRKNYRGGVRGKRLLLGLIFLCVVFLIVLGNLITLVVLASALRLDSRGSYYFSFPADDLFRVYSSLFADRMLLDGRVTSDPSLSISSLSEVQLIAGTLLSDETGVISLPSALSVARDSVSTHNLSFDSTLRSHQLEARDGTVRLHSLLLEAPELTASSGIETTAVQARNSSLQIRGDSAIQFEGGRGTSLSTQTLFLSADNGTLRLQANSINISAFDSVLLSGRELTGSEGGTTSPQLRLCACQDGSLFLLSHTSNNCLLRGPAGGLC